jgi:hypothetical protein
MDYDIMSNLSTVGFPIAITAYLLLRFENKLEMLTNAINELCKRVGD